MMFVLAYTLLFGAAVLVFFVFFFFNDTATTEIYTLSLHDALPIWPTLLPKSHSGLRYWLRQAKIWVGQTLITG